MTTSAAQIQTTPATPAALDLQPIAGPEAPGITVAPGTGITIGRGKACELCLTHPEVSRRHCEIVGRTSGAGGAWFALDLGSMSGTLVNGVRIRSDTPTKLSHADSIRIGPYVFRVALAGADTGAAAVTVDDRLPAARRGWGGPGVSLRPPAPSADRRLRLLTDCLAVLASAPDEPALAALTLRGVLDESGYARGAVLRRVGGDKDVEVVAEQRRDPADTRPFVFSRSLVRAAASGSVAVLSEQAPVPFGASVADLAIHSALCAPISVAGASPDGFLYLDARGQESAVRPEADGFCESFARAYGLALANLKRQELERGQRALQAELDAAREVQQFILPPRAGRIGPLEYAMEMHAGVIIAGDVFDVIPLPEGRVAVAMGDVAGHGMGPALLMAAVQAHLHARLLADPEPAAAVAGVNRYLVARATEGRFASLWLGVFDPDGTLRYVDAGHGYWAVQRRGEPPATPDERSIVLGVDTDATYPSNRIRLNRGDRIGLFSDGLLEQRNESGFPFGRDRLLGLMAAGAVHAVVRAVFEAVEEHAGGVALADDATAAVLEYGGGPP